MEIPQEKTTQKCSQLLTLHSMHPKTWVEIDKQAFEHNIKQYKKVIQPALLAPVIKSNAYGHGLEIIAQLCDAHQDVDRICLVSLSEAVFLRSIGVKKPLLVLSILDEDLEKVALHDIAVTIYDLETAYALNSVGKKFQKKIAVHIKIDTGLSRLGFGAASAFSAITIIATLPFIIIEGMYTHFANSESAQHDFLCHQLMQFNALIEQTKKSGIIIPLLHTSCSAAILATSSTHFTMARTGIGIYGLWPSESTKSAASTNHPWFSLKPVLTWKTSIIHLKEIPAGSFVGYDCTHQTTQTTRVATLPVGYWDGYDRKLSNNGVVMIKNRYAPVVGRVAMNLMMIDVTEIDVAVGDPVTLLAGDSEITAEMIAAKCGTINYEVVTRINQQISRVVV